MTTEPSTNEQLRTRAVPRRAAGNPDEGGVDVLDRTTCLDLLRTVEVGRLAWADDDGRIQVRPVNFGLDGESVLIRCRDGAMLAAARGERPVSFEADAIEPALRTGWSVLVVGAGSEVRPGPEADVLAGLVEPWATGQRPHLLRLRAEEITGRRLRLGPGAVSVVRLGADEPPD